MVMSVANGFLKLDTYTVIHIWADHNFCPSLFKTEITLLAVVLYTLIIDYLAVQPTRKISISVYSVSIRIKNETYILRYLTF